MKLGRLRSAPVASPPPGESWSLEVQIHPSDIRKRVRYLFLSRAQLTAWSMLALVYIAGMAVSAAVAPGVVIGVMKRQEIQDLAAERSRQGQRLQELIHRMDQLGQQAAALDLRMEKVFLAYGLPAPPAPQRRLEPLSVEASSGAIYARAIEHGYDVQAHIRQRLGALDAALRQARSFEEKHPEEVRATPSVSPLQNEFVLVSPFGSRRSAFTKQMELHTGTDLAAPLGTPVYATADGVVAFAGEYPVGRSATWWRLGRVVMLENGAGFVTVYGHHDEIRVRRGQRVERGDLLGTVGNTGWSTSPHLHYEVRRKGADGVYRPVDPLIYILDRRWPNEERLLVRARSARPLRDFEPLPSSIGR